MFPNASTINEIAAELGVSAAFIEKDWYAVQVLKKIAEYQSSHIEVLFAGGTSLSKGYGLIPRFSEDLDFRCRYLTSCSNNQNKSNRRVFRANIIKRIQEINQFGFDEDKLTVASHYIKFPLSYPHLVEEHASLRPDLEVEFSFTQPRLQPELKSIQSLVAQFTQNPPETEILCLSPIETGADKLSALIWRVLKRDRNNYADDATLIRHLHDLCALKTVVDKNKEVFARTTQFSFEEDQKTGKRNTAMSLHLSMKAALE